MSVDSKLKHCTSLQSKVEELGFKLRGSSVFFVGGSVNHNTKQTEEKEEFRRLARKHCFSKQKYLAQDGHSFLFSCLSKQSSVCVLYRLRVAIKK